jgi:tRNA1(Val) A37 N6-methylase TrmN6
MEKEKETVKEVELQKRLNELAQEFAQQNRYKQELEREISSLKEFLFIQKEEIEKLRK